MLAYLVKRLIVSIVVLLGIALLTFLMIHLVPGDPAKIQLGVHATPEAVASSTTSGASTSPGRSSSGSTSATSSPSTSASRPRSARAYPK